MSNDDPPFGGQFPFDPAAFGQLFGTFGGGDPWAQAGRVAEGVAGDGGTEPNVDPVARMAIDDLARLADLQVRQVGGPALSARTTVVAVTRAEWARRSVEVYRPFFERFGDAVSQPAREELAREDEASLDPFSKMFTQMFTQMGPMLVSMTAGSMIGHHAQRVLGQYDLPIPRPSDEILVVPTAIDQAAAEWGIPVEEVRLWILVHELAAHAVLSVPHIGRRIDDLCIDFATAFRLDTPKLLEAFGDIDPAAGFSDLSQLASLAERFNDPQQLLSMMRTPAHNLILPQLQALVAVVLGTVDHLVTRVCGPLIPSHELIRQHTTDRLAEVTPADRFTERLLGVELTETTIERGRRFVAGVVERVGDDGLARLWSDELDLPTAAEVDAPGLWLARIGLDPDVGEVLSQIPDDLSGLDDLGDSGEAG